KPGLLAADKKLLEAEGKQTGPARKVSAVPAGPRVADLAKVRLEAARVVFQLMMKTERAGRSSPVEFWQWSPHLLDAELDAATTKSERVAAREEHLRRM